jgi:zinc protease
MADRRPRDERVAVRSNPSVRSPSARNEDALKKTTKADLQRFYQSTFGPKNAALIMVGDLTESEAKKLATDAFGSWKGDAVAAAVPAQGTMVNSRVVIVDKPAANQTTLLAGQFGVKRSDPDYEKLDVMNTVLGGLFSSRINLNLREDKGYSYGAFSFVGQNRGGAVHGRRRGPRGRDGRVDPGDPERSDQAQGVGHHAAELVMAKDSMTRSLPANFETTFSTAGTIAQIYMYDLPIDYYQTLPSRVDAIQASDVLSVAKKYLVPERMVVVAVGDRASIEPQITKLNLGAIAYRDADGKETTGSASTPTSSSN